MKNPGSDEISGQFRVYPAYFTMLFCIGFLTLGICTLTGLIPFSSQNTFLSVVMSIVSPIVFILIFPCAMWGYDLDPEYFTIRLLFFPVRRVPWREISQVIRVRTFHHIRNGIRYRRLTVEFIRIAIKPAEPFPYFSTDALSGHWRRNIFLVWTLRFLVSKARYYRCIRYIEQYWGEVELREFGNPENR